MKTKTINKVKISFSTDRPSQSQQDDSMSINSESLDTYNSDKIVGSRKRKSPKPTAQDDNGDFEHLQSNRKRKHKKGDGNENKSDFQLAMDKAVDFNVESSKQDNTPKSLVKQKKTKKKKNKSQPVSVQPNSSILDYLTRWKNKRGNWKFEKVKQTRLVTNMFENEKLPDAHFDIFLEYMEGGSKSMKELMSKMANEVVEEMEKWESLTETEKVSTPKVNEIKYNRARTVLQMLQ
ncbi:uncharacterized protein C7orf50 homolog isoform X1 [Macrosteles quadrilineatus]|uniref:uncharacterized protein C7orf50 homolog isoform X1 n=2 Tax=Macrosteles quadrilineatus TaxID=74068 RepID=UPI0023E2F25B|nr:uncharacterized protein C7orf50 homolog isoform X1 [Macrosteles quadrilineatus]